MRLAEAGFHAIAPDMRRLRADGSPRTTRSVHAAPSCWRRGRPARCFRHRDGGDHRTRLGRLPPSHGTPRLLRPDRFRGVIGLSVPFIPRQPMFVLPALCPRPEDAQFFQLRTSNPQASPKAEFERDVRLEHGRQLPLLGFQGTAGMTVQGTAAKSIWCRVKVAFSRGINESGITLPHWLHQKRTWIST